MSTPNTSKVKWVLEKDLFASYAKVAEYQERDNIAAPVIALADLTELVEGLQELLRLLDLAYPWVGSGSGCRKELGEAIQQSRNHLTQLEEHKA